MRIVYLQPDVGVFTHLTDLRSASTEIRRYVTPLVATKFSRRRRGRSVQTENTYMHRIIAVLVLAYSFTKTRKFVLSQNDLNELFVLWHSNGHNKMSIMPLQINGSLFKKFIDWSIQNNFFEQLEESTGKNRVFKWTDKEIIKMIESQ